MICVLTFLCSNFLSSFPITTSQRKEFVLINPQKYLKKESNLHLKEENQFSWYYVHLLTKDISKIQKYISINGEDKLIKDTYVLYLSKKQLAQISTISLVKRIEPEDKFYEDSISFSSTNYLIVFTHSDFKLHTVDGIYKVLMQNSEHSFIIQIECDNLTQSEISDKKQKTIKILTKIPEVKIVTPFVKPILHNAITAGYTQKNSFDFKRLPNRGYYYIDRYLNLNGINGSGEIITILDTILDYTHSMFRDDNVTFELNTPMPNHRKIVYYGYDYPQYFIDDMFDDEHGTHTAAAAAGKSNCNEDIENISYFNGIAPEAKILYGGYYSDVSTMTLHYLMRTYQSNISTNSWGSRGHFLNYNYPYTKLAISNPQIIFIFAAGNNYNELGNFSISDPGGSKNVLSVGAIDSFYENPSYTFIRLNDSQVVFVASRVHKTTYPYLTGTIGNEIGKSKFYAIDTMNGNQCDLIDSNNTFVLLYGEDAEWFHQCNYVPANQVYWTENKTAVLELLNTEVEVATLPKFSMKKNITINRADYSSTGPGFHGILKPDVMAPGTQVISARSQAHSTTPHGCLENFFNDLKVLDGTSMATPNVAGAAALVRQYFKSGKWIDNVYIDGATTRALLINSCGHPSGSKIPDNFYGHGVVDLSTILPIEDDFGVQITHQETSSTKRPSVKENGHVVSKLKIDNSKSIKKLQITLSYLDPVLSQDSLIPINHDLDLVVISPSKKVYLGDHLSNNDTQHASTNEKVIVNEEELEEGEYEIHVFGGVFADSFNDQNDEEQEFSVVATGPIENKYLEFNESKECLCNECNPDHPGLCMCNENQNIGPLCQVNIENVDEKKGMFTVKPLHIKRIRFVTKSYITGVTSRSSKPGRYATIWVSEKCHLSLGEYEINGETVNETTEEKPINIGWNTTEICVAIFNDNDVDATYFINVTSDDDKDNDDETSSFESTDIPIEFTTESQILSQSMAPSSSSSSDYTESKTETKTPSFSDSDLIPTYIDTITTSISEIDNETNAKNDKKIIIVIVLAVVLAIVIAIVATVIIVVSMKKNKNDPYSTPMTLFEKSTSTLEDSLLEK